MAHETPNPISSLSPDQRRYLHDAKVCNVLAENCMHAARAAASAEEAVPYVKNAAYWEKMQRKCLNNARSEHPYLSFRSFPIDSPQQNRGRRE